MVRSVVRKRITGMPASFIARPEAAGELAAGSGSSSPPPTASRPAGCDRKRGHASSAVGEFRRRLRPFITLPRHVVAFAPVWGQCGRRPPGLGEVVLQAPGQATARRAIFFGRAGDRQEEVRAWRTIEDGWRRCTRR